MTHDISDLVSFVGANFPTPKLTSCRPPLICSMMLERKPNAWQDSPLSVGRRAVQTPPGILGVSLSNSIRKKAIGTGYSTIHQSSFSEILQSSQSSFIHRSGILKRISRMLPCEPSLVNANANNSNTDCLQVLGLFIDPPRVCTPSHASIF